MNSEFGLVVITDREEVPSCSGEEQGEVELRLVQVLCLVHEEHGRSRPPSREESP